jgi:tripartite-type tricarboxylate transporter receptor subunit TctC
VFAINPLVPARSIAELVALVGANPGKYNFASPGTGTGSHLVGEQFRISLRLDLVHVPFSGGGPAAASVIAGHTPIYIGSPVPVVQQAKDGKLVPLAVTSRRRAPTLPDVPTMAEAGYPDLKGEAWIGMFVPAGTPQEIVTTLNRVGTKIITLPDIKARLETLGYLTVGSTPDDFAKRIKIDIETWSRVIKTAGITPQ